MHEAGEHENRILSGKVLRGLLFPVSWKQVSSLEDKSNNQSTGVKLTFFSFRERTAEGCERRGAVRWRWRLGADPRRGCWRTLPATVSIENQLSGATRPYQLSILALASSGQISRESRAKVQGTLPTVLEVYHVSALPRTMSLAQCVCVWGGVYEPPPATENFAHLSCFKPLSCLQSPASLGKH